MRLNRKDAESLGIVKRRNKYGAKPTVVDGIRFASKKEADYYVALKFQRDAKKSLRYFLMQVPFHLPGGVRYVVDFMLMRSDGIVEYHDVKGVRTDVYRIKKKQVEALYGVRIEEL